MRRLRRCLRGRGGDAGNALQQALEAQQRAEAMQRDRQHAPQQQAQPQSIEEYIDRLPDLSEHERDFLRQHPALLHPEVAPIMRRVYYEGLHGLQDDTPELDLSVGNKDELAKKRGDFVSGPRA